MTTQGLKAHHEISPVHRSDNGPIRLARMFSSTCRGVNIPGMTVETLEIEYALAAAFLALVQQLARAAGHRGKAVKEKSPFPQEQLDLGVSINRR
jgi:hypothetical protein